MIKHIWTVLARESKIDADNNTISLIDLYENLQFDVRVDEKEYEKNKKVGGPFNFEIVSLFYRDTKGKAEKILVEVDLVDPKGEKLGTAEANVEFKETHDRMRNRIKFTTIALTTSGTYVFQVYMKKQENKKELLTAIPLDVALTVNGKKM